MLTARPGFRVGYRKRSTTTALPTRTSSSKITSNTTTPSPRLTKTKPSRRKLVPRRNSTTAKPVESQASTTSSPTRFTNRFKFVSRKSFLRHTTSSTVPSKTADQSLESSVQQPLEKHTTVSPEVATVTSIALALQQAAVPQAKPSRTRLQYLRPNPGYSLKSATTQSSSSTHQLHKGYSSVSPRYSSKTIAITVPYMKELSEVKVQSIPQAFTADQFASNRATSSPLVSGVFNSPKAISAQEFINKYATSLQPSTRSKSRYPTTEVPLVIITPNHIATTKSRRPTKAFDKVPSGGQPKNVYQPIEYDYYDNVEASILGKIPAHSKVLLHSNGILECLDQGNFPHPLSCRKFIYCAKMDNDKIIGWEYTCPKNLSFDPIGGMCNWSAGLGCNET